MQRGSFSTHDLNQLARAASSSRPPPRRLPWSPVVARYTQRSYKFSFLIVSSDPPRLSAPRCSIVFHRGLPDARRIHWLHMIYAFVPPCCCQRSYVISRSLSLAQAASNNIPMVWLCMYIFMYIAVSGTFKWKGSVCCARGVFSIPVN